MLSRHLLNRWRLRHLLNGWSGRPVLGRRGNSFEHVASDIHLALVTVLLLIHALVVQLRHRLQAELGSEQFGALIDLARLSKSLLRLSLAQLNIRGDFLWWIRRLAAAPAFAFLLLRILRGLLLLRSGGLLDLSDQLGGKRLIF